MPEKKTIERAEKDKKQGKAASTQAGEFVREEIHHVREGKHGARSAKQAIAIGLSKAGRAGVDLKPPPGSRKKGAASKGTREKAEQDLAEGHTHKKPAPKRSAASKKALRREPKSAASHQSLSSHAKKAAAARKSRS